ncbi:MAG: molecular chaperone DnaJ [Spirochaetales bacterium]|nr:MAG: molecular chaperone DnaJ [Spirochaetales bacterium]
MKDYYAILGVSPDADLSTVRKAFREKAKEVHPDTAGSTGTARFLAIKEAWEILSSAAGRESYDISRRAAKRSESRSDWDYRDFLHGRKDDPESLARLICYDLLHDRDTEALNLYDSASGGGFFSLKDYLDREDFMDYAFLLAEAYLERGALVKAYRLLRGIAELEEEHPYFRHFYVEVLEKMASIVRRSLPDDNENRLRMAFISDLVTFSYPDREEARLRKLLSELLSAAGRYEEAAVELRKAYELAPTMPGLAETVKMMRETGF